MSVQVMFWYSEEIVNKAWFVAESEEQGKELLRQLDEGEITTDDLPEFYSKNKSYEVVLDKPEFYQLEEEAVNA